MTLPRAIVTAYRVNPDEPMHEWISVELTCRAGEGPHRPPGDTWAVRKGGWCLNDNYEWEFEPIPSSRDEAFYARTRWPLEEALERAREIVSERPFCPACDFNYNACTCEFDA